MKEHLREIRSLRQRLEDSIHTNDRLRQQLEEKLARTTTEKGNRDKQSAGLKVLKSIEFSSNKICYRNFIALNWIYKDGFFCHSLIFHSSVSISSKGAPTNIYIQGLESVNQLASEIRLLKEENVSLQNQLKQVTKGTVCLSPCHKLKSHYLYYLFRM